MYNMYFGFIYAFLHENFLVDFFIVKISFDNPIHKFKER